MAARRWAIEEFGDAKLGDARRTRRLVDMASALLRRPRGIVAEAFRDDAAQQGAYDFLESRLVSWSALEAAAGQSCAHRAADENGVVIVPIDGSTLSLSDPAKSKEVGTTTSEGRGRGVRVVTALTLAPTGTPVGVAGQQFWVRDEPREGSPREKKRADRKRPSHLREVRHWVSLIERVDARFKAASATPWYVVDREGDGYAILSSLIATGAFFTVRANHDRVIGDELDERTTVSRPRYARSRRHLRAAMRRHRIFGHYELDIPEGPGRTARKARIVVRCRRLSLHVKIDHYKAHALPMNVVWLSEQGTAPSGEEPIDWMLYSNHAIETADDIEKIVRSYIQRWRIEEFHKMWKSSGCDIERTQLRSLESIAKWATILASVAARIERLKHLSRSEPDLPASVELSDYELRALLLLKRKAKKRTETIVDDPTIAQATRWIADLGGYTASKAAGPPGALTIARGLADVLVAARVIEELERAQKRRNK